MMKINFIANQDKKNLSGFRCSEYFYIMFRVLIQSYYSID
jgi:hypothetical protein